MPFALAALLLDGQVTPERLYRHDDPETFDRAQDIDFEFDDSLDGEYQHIEVETAIRQHPGRRQRPGRARRDLALIDWTQLGRRPVLKLADGSTPGHGPRPLVQLRPACGP